MNHIALVRRIVLPAIAVIGLTSCSPGPPVTSGVLLDKGMDQGGCSTSYVTSGNSTVPVTSCWGDSYWLKFDDKGTIGETGTDEDTYERAQVGINYPNGV